MSRIFSGTGFPPLCWLALALSLMGCGRKSSAPSATAALAVPHVSNTRTQSERTTLAPEAVAVAATPTASPVPPTSEASAVAAPTASPVAAPVVSPEITPALVADPIPGVYRYADGRWLLRMYPVAPGVYAGVVLGSASDPTFRAGVLYYTRNGVSGFGNGWQASTLSNCEYFHTVQWQWNPAGISYSVQYETPAGNCPRTGFSGGTMVKVGPLPALPPDPMTGIYAYSDGRWRQSVFRVDANVFAGVVLGAATDPSFRSLTVFFRGPGASAGFSNGASFSTYDSSCAYFHTNQWQWSPRAIGYAVQYEAVPYGCSPTGFGSGVMFKVAR